MMGNTMGKRNRLFDMEIDEVSFVRRGANQHAPVAFSKSHGTTEEETVGFYDENGVEVDIDALDVGDVVFDEDGDAFAVTQDEDGDEAEGQEQFEYEYEDDDDREPALVGKSFGDDVMEAISKAVNDDERTSIISKAFAQQQYELEIAKAQAEEAQMRADAEHDARVTEAFIAKAEEFNLPVAPTVLGPILKKMTTVLDDQELDIIEKVFTSAGDMIYDEIGYVGGGDNASVMDQVNMTANDGDISPEQAAVAMFESNPEAYDAYLAEQNGR
jgi:hypothetical protein